MFCRAVSSSTSFSVSSLFYMATNIATKIAEKKLMNWGFLVCYSPRPLTKSIICLHTHTHTHTKPQERKCGAVEQTSE